MASVLIPEIEESSWDNEMTLKRFQDCPKRKIWD